MKLVCISSGLFIILIILLSSTCNRLSFENRGMHVYSGIDSVWLKFAKAMDSKDIDFLIKNSLDSVTCYDCNIGVDSSKEYFNTKFIFTNHLDKIKHLQVLLNKPFSTYKVDNDYAKVVYNIRVPQAPEKDYGLFFTLVKKVKTYYFQGMMVQ